MSNFTAHDGDLLWAIAMLQAASLVAPNTPITLSAGEKTELTRILGRTIA